jgi:hypothetical protein
MGVSTLILVPGRAVIGVPPPPSENTTRISDHVWAIMGFPNVAIVVGSHATLVVDTGLGPKNGATAARVAAKLAPNNPKLFLITTTSIRSTLPVSPAFLASSRRRIKSCSRALYCARPT